MNEAIHGYDGDSFGNESLLRASQKNLQKIMLSTTTHKKWSPVWTNSPEWPSRVGQLCSTSDPYEFEPSKVWQKKASSMGDLDIASSKMDREVWDVFENFSSQQHFRWKPKQTRKVDRLPTLMFLKLPFTQNITKPFEGEWFITGHHVITSSSVLLRFGKGCIWGPASHSLHQLWHTS